MPELTRIRQLRADVDDRQESAEDVRADDAGEVLLSNCRKEERHALAPPRRDRQVVLSAYQGRGGGRVEELGRVGAGAYRPVSRTDRAGGDRLPGEAQEVGCQPVTFLYNSL